MLTYLNETQLHRNKLKHVFNNGVIKTNGNNILNKLLKYAVVFAKFNTYSHLMLIICHSTNVVFWVHKGKSTTSIWLG